MWIMSINFNPRSQVHLYLFLLPVLFALCFMPASQTFGGPVQETVPDGAQALLRGKNYMECGNYEKAIALLTVAYEKLPLLGDYALLWRAKAYEGAGNSDRALQDLRSLKEKYRESRLVKKAEFREIKLLEKKNGPSTGMLLEGMVKDNPWNMEIKYAYAQWLKENNDQQKARELLREVFIAACPLSARASNELSPSDVTAEDLMKKGKALNTAWRFEEAEKVLREALARSGRALNTLPAGDDFSAREITDSLAYSLFRQKRYKDAADLYKITKNSFWRARSIFRAGDNAVFQSELPEFSNAADNRVATVILAYGGMKRREGDTEEALKIFDTVLTHYPSAREETLWSEGWTYYLSRDYRNAYKIFSKLTSTYGDSKYLYWSRKCGDLLGYKAPPGHAEDQENSHDFYAYLTLLKNKRKPPVIGKTHLKASLNQPASARIDILTSIGLKDEAAADLLFLSRKNPAPGDLVSISLYLKKLGYYKTSIALISKVPYNEELHELYYPLAFWSEVEEASGITSLDPYMILSVMREESRFEPEAQSIAGAIGLMQMMPQTALRYKKNMKVHLEKSRGPASVQLEDARTNIMLGSFYLKQLLNRFGSIPVALASYNGGEDAVNDWLKKGKYKTVDEFIEDIPYDETRNYVKKVMTTYFEYLRSNSDGKFTLTNTHIGEL